MSYFLIKSFILLVKSLCSLCNLYDETPFHVFYKCDRVKFLWSSLIQCFQNSLILTTLLPHTASFWILDPASNDSTFKNNEVFINHILLIFKLYVYKSRGKKFVNLNNLTAEIQKVKRIKKKF